jgi:multicomponent Na+:H+ antiporter subunit E
MHAEAPAAQSPHAPVVPWSRILAFYVVWVLLAGTGTAELLAGIPAAAISGWLSWKLLPGHAWRWRPAGVVKLCGLLLRDSVVAGVEVALMAFRPRLRMNQGIASHRTRLPEGGMRAFFNTYNSLMPGTLAVESKDADTLQFHCLDLDAPVHEVLTRYETLLLDTMQRKGGESG